jgi:ribonucleotide reductase beta subunit family protein with ferritin-like domain
MTTAEQINRNIHNLPAAFQQEVLDFVEFLLQKTVRDEKDWSEFSLEQAMRGLENDGMPEYSDADLRDTSQ